MNGKIDRWGNSLALRIPQALAKRVDLREGDHVEFEVEGNALRIKRARPKYTLDELLVGLNPDMVDRSWADDVPVGKERFWEDEEE